MEKEDSAICQEAGPWNRENNHIETDEQSKEITWSHHSQAAKLLKSSRLNLKKLFCSHVNSLGT